MSAAAGAEGGGGGRIVSPPSRNPAWAPGTPVVIWGTTRYSAATRVAGKTAQPESTAGSIETYCAGARMTESSRVVQGRICGSVPLVQPAPASDNSPRVLSRTRRLPIMRPPHLRDLTSAPQHPVVAETRVHLVEAALRLDRGLQRDIPLRERPSQQGGKRNSQST